MAGGMTAGEAETALVEILDSLTEEEKAAREAQRIREENARLAAASPRLPGMGMKVSRRKPPDPEAA